MEGTFEFFLKDGRTCVLEAKYECVMGNEVIDADGDRIIGQPKPTTAGRCDMVAYIDGEKIDSCDDPNFWCLIDLMQVPGVKKIWGLKIGLVQPADIERYEKWIAEIIDGGKSDAVKAYEKAKKETGLEAALQGARKLILMAEMQKDIPTRKELKMRMKQYNDLMNEGGEGYVPYIVSIEEYNNAKRFLEEYENDRKD